MSFASSLRRSCNRQSHLHAIKAIPKPHSMSHKLDHNKLKKKKKKQSKRPVVQKMKGTVAAAVVVAALAVAFLATVSHGAVTCGDVDTSLRPCVGYVTGKEAAPPAECCEGVRRLRALPTSTAERRFACDCAKKAAARYKGLSSDAIRDLPAACGSPLPFPLALDFDCNTIP